MLEFYWARCYCSHSLCPKYREHARKPKPHFYLPHPENKITKKGKDFRPISLCNVLYKIVSKNIANQLKKIIPKLVSETQSAFMFDRLISDNILMAFETLHHLRNKRNGKSSYMALKLDMSKAYDRMEWVFLGKMMEKLCFDNKLNHERSNKNSNRIFGHHPYWVLSRCSFVGRAKKQSFSYIKERIWHKIQGWKKKLLSQGGGEILIRWCSKPCQPTPWVASCY